MLQACGANCEGCPSFQKECAGCDQIKGKVYWAQYIGQVICPMYQCCHDKALKHCGSCSELPCKMWYEIKDPSYSDEEHIHSINERVRLLKEHE